jgi:hypothetical protein
MGFSVITKQGERGKQKMKHLEKLWEELKIYNYLLGELPLTDEEIEVKLSSDDFETISQKIPEWKLKKVFKYLIQITLNEIEETARDLKNEN